MDKIKKAVASNLKKYRLEKKLTQKQLADELNARVGTEIKHNTISSWENATNSIDTTLLKTICDILEIDINTIYGVTKKEEITTIAAHFDGEEFTEEELEEIESFKRYVLSKREDKK